MRRRSTWPALLTAMFIAASQASADVYSFHHEDVMGTSLELRVLAVDEHSADGAEGRVLGEIDRLSGIFSNHSPASEFRRWQASRSRMAISRELAEVLERSDAWRLRSGGAFDPRIQTLTSLWTEAARAGRMPTRQAIEEARARLALPAWRLDRAASIAERLSDAPLTLDAIAKGSIVEHAAAVGLDREHGVMGLMLNVGGDLRVIGDLDIPIGVTSPLADSETSEPISVIKVRDRAVATSGRSQRYFSIDGRRYSHIIDPRTGRPAEGSAGATVIARDSTDADALATTLNILSPEEGLRLVESLDDVACLIVGTDARAHRSRRWGRFESAPEPEPAANHPDDGSWDTDYELAIDFEINSPGGAEARRYRRPYVAIWVEDKDGKAVRTITLWLSLGGAGPDRWVPDLKRWYPADLERKKRTKRDLVYTIARATRQPGKYSAIWDGKDDDGKLVDAGDYILMIETAREHGTYQIIKAPITVAGKPFARGLKGNVEIKSAAIAYRRKSSGK